MLKTKWLLLISIISISLFSSCETTPTQTYQPSNPGLYNLKGWNNQYVYNQIASGIDIDGQIGYPLSVADPSANCILSTGEHSAVWNGYASVTTGSLPPGLTIDNSTIGITGIPTARGHWIVTVSLNNITCNGQTYPSFTQELRFHIKGSGQVTE